MRRIWKNALLLGALVVGAHAAQGQTVAESAGTASSSRMAAQAGKAPTFASGSAAKQSAPPPNSAKQTPSPHIVERNGPPLDEVNLKQFEDHAGEKGGKLMLLSTPSGADIFINDLLVGRTPLLMAITPGPYKVEMRGARDDTGHAHVGIVPLETRTVAIDLKQRYPSSISLR
jgi:hypothetical protein